MRPFRTLLAAAVSLGFAASVLTTPSVAADRDRPRHRTVTQANVFGRDAGSEAARPTSFEPLAGPRRAASEGRIGDAAASTLVPTEVFGFDALSDPLSRPSDTTGALGQSFVVAAVNTQVAVYDRAGVEIVGPIQLDVLHPTTAGRFAFDPKVVYDAYHDTFVLVYLVQEDVPRRSTIVAVSIPDATANDVGTWCATAFDGDQVAADPKLWADYPSLGFDATRVTISTNQFTFPSATARFRYAQLMSIDSVDLYDCAAPDPVPTVFAGARTRDPQGRQAFTIQPAQTVGVTPASQLLVSFQAVRGRLDYLTLWRIAPGPRGLALTRGIVLTGKVHDGPTPFGTQAGGSLVNGDLYWDTGDHRLIGAVYDADRDELFTAHAVRRNLRPDTITGGYPEAAIRWYDVDPETRLADSTLDRRGTVGDAEVDVGWPSVATDDQGNLFVTYSRASAPRGEFLSAWVAEIPAGTTTATQLLLQSGLATYDRDPGPDRWGDYTAINRDPLVGTDVATFNQYASTPTRWQQVVHVVRHV